MSDFKIGNSTITSPTDWSQVENGEDKISFRAPDGRLQATISIMRFAVNPSFEDFKRICEHRVKAEKEVGDGPVQSQDPFVVSETFGMYFYSEEPKTNSLLSFVKKKKTYRRFFGYLTQYRGELLTVYLEGIGVPSKDFTDAFSLFYAGIKRV